jgi:hypothetical protein
VRNIVRTYLLLPCLLFAACGESEKSTKSGGGLPAAVELLPYVDPVKPPQLSAARRFRRLAIELHNALPTLADLDWVSEQPAALLYEVMVADPRVGHAVAGMHRRFWRMDSKPGLSNLVTAAELTPDDATAIANEPTWMLAQVLATDRSYADLLFGKSSIVNAAARSAIGLPAGEEIGQDLFLTSYADARPGLGILTTAGFFGGLPVDEPVPSRRRAAEFFSRVFCAGFSSESAHLFYTLEPTMIDANLSQRATVERECRSCHGQFAGIDNLFRGVFSGSSLAAWRSYTGNGSLTGRVGSIDFADVGELADILVEDPRLASCTAKGIFQAILQRKANVQDPGLTGKALREFNRTGTLRALLLELIKSEEFGFDGFSNNQEGEWLKRTSGVRYLTEYQWRGIARQLLGRDLTPENYLEPGGMAVDPRDDFRPAGLYYHSAERFARRLASAIVARDLADDFVTTERNVLRKLPGNGLGSASQVAAQVVELWQQLSAEKLAAGDDMTVSFAKLYDLGKGTDATITGARQGWRAVLTAMLLHPRFVSY